MEDNKREFCFICNIKTEKYHRNLCNLKSRYSGILLSSLIENILNEVGSQRLVNDTSNVICVDCAKLLLSYDWMLLSIKTKKTQIRDLISKTEIELLTNPIETNEFHINTPAEGLILSENLPRINGVLVESEAELILQNTESSNNFDEDETRDIPEIVVASNPLANIEPNEMRTNSEQKLVNIQSKVNSLRLVPRTRMSLSTNQLPSTSVKALNRISQSTNNNLIHAKNKPIVVITKVKSTVTRPISDTVSVNLMKKNPITATVPINSNSTLKEMPTNLDEFVQNNNSNSCTKCDQAFTNKKIHRVSASSFKR